MLHSILKRIALAVPTLLVACFFVFFAAREAPSDPIIAKLGEKATPQEIARLREAYGLNRPILVQFGSYVSAIVLHGDFGTSYVEDGYPVSRMIAQEFPITAELAVCALIFAMVVGLPAGILAAVFHNSWFDRAAMAVVVAMVSVPSIVLGPVLVLAIAVDLHWLPVSGWDSPRNVILPTIALGSRSAALLARFMRASLLEVLRQDYLRTAEAKGLSRFAAVRRHALKNAFLPVLTVIGTNFGALLTGSFVVETIFQVPGIGYKSIASITTRDYPVIQGMALLVATTYILVNLSVDIMYGIIDPRIRIAEAA